MAEKAISIFLILTGIIHLLPVTGVLGSSRLRALYGIQFDEPNLLLLMQHRAVLFGLLGAFLIYAAFQPSFQIVAFIAGLISVISFILLAKVIGGYNSLIGRVVVADIIALISLLAAIGLYITNKIHLQL